MINCRNCQHGNVTGAVFCAECSEPLGGNDDVLIPVITDERVTEELKKKASRPELATPVYSWLSLHFVGMGKILPLAARNEFILGRLTDDSPIIPDVDLTPFQAGAAGVSRLHAMVKREANKAMVRDLGSSNGTYLNGQRIDPDVEVALRHQDIIGLGALQIQILLHDM